jgi:hypothetical protein
MGPRHLLGLLVLLPAIDHSSGAVRAFGQTGEIAGELALTGELRAIRGVLAVVLSARRFPTWPRCAGRGRRSEHSPSPRPLPIAC